MSIDLSAKTAWIFDLDGTLTISVHDFDHMRKELGMNDNADILQVLASKKGQEKLDLTEKLDALEEYYAKKAAPAAGVANLISMLSAKKCQLAIFTRNTKEMAILSLKAIGVYQYFDDIHIIGRDDAPHKPDPSALFYLLKQWNVTNTEAVMVGDFKFDLETARAADITSVHIPVDQQRWPLLTDHCYDSLDELCAALLYR